MRCSHRPEWRRHAFRAVALCTATAFTFAAVGVRAADPVPSNIDLLTQMTQEIADELYTKFGPELGGRAVALHPFATGEDYVFVGNVFANVLTDKSVKTIVGAPTPAPATNAALGGAPPAGSDPAPTPTDAVIFTFQNVAFGVQYADVYRSHLVGGKRVKRRADVRIHATVTDASGTVLWVGEAARERADEFDMGDSARVEQGVYQFARPVVPGGGWGKYAEPVFVTGIIVGLIYLFFSNQSDN